MYEIFEEYKKVGRLVAELYLTQQRGCSVAVKMFKLRRIFEEKGLKKPRGIYLVSFWQGFIEGAEELGWRLEEAVTKPNHNKVIVVRKQA